MNEQPISKTEYCKRKNYSIQSLIKAINEKRLVNGIVIVDNKQMIIESIADEELSKTHNPNYPQGVLGKPKDVTTDVQKYKENKKKESDELFTIKLQQEKVKLEIAEIELEKIKGELLSKAIIEKELFSMGQIIREKFSIIPDRVIDSIMSCDNRNQAHQLLETEIHNVLTEISNILEL